jgi:hypothetical protein
VTEAPLTKKALAIILPSPLPPPEITAVLSTTVYIVFACNSAMTVDIIEVLIFWVLDSTPDINKADHDLGVIEKASESIPVLHN